MIKIPHQLLLAVFFTPLFSFAQDIRKDEIDPSTKQRIVETSIEALAKGFIYRFRSIGDAKYIEVRIQKHGSFSVLDGDTLVFKLSDGSQVKGIAVRGGQGDIPYRPKSPGIKSLWSLFQISPAELTTQLVTSACIAPKNSYIGFDEDLSFPKVKKQPAEMFKKSARLITGL